MAHYVARAGFQAKTLILLYLNSDKLTCMGTMYAKEKCSSVLALNPFLVLVYALLPSFAMNSAQQSGVQFFPGETSFPSVRSLLTHVLTLMETH